MENIIQKTVQGTVELTPVRDMTNEQLKKIIQEIKVNKDGNANIYLRLFGDFGLDVNVLICDDETYRLFERPIKRLMGVGRKR